MVGRAAALLEGLHVETQPYGWRFAGRPGHDEGRARALLREDLDELAEALADADVVISCTGSTGLAITLADVADAQVARGGRRQAFVDLALPHDIGQEVADLTGVVRLGLAELGEHSASATAYAAAGAGVLGVAAFVLRQRRLSGGQRLFFPFRNF